MYGEAAATMERFYTTYEQKLMEFPDHMVWGGWVKDFDKEALQTMQKLLDKAKGQIDSPLSLFLHVHFGPSIARQFLHSHQ